MITILKADGRAEQEKIAAMRSRAAEVGVDIERSVAEVMRNVKEKGYEVVATRDTHFSEDDELEARRYSNTQEGKNLPVAHCIKGTDGWEINDTVKEAMGDVKVFDK